MNGLRNVNMSVVGTIKGFSPACIRDGAAGNLFLNSAMTFEKLQCVFRNIFLSFWMPKRFRNVHTEVLRITWPPFHITLVPLSAWKEGLGHFGCHNADLKWFVNYAVIKMPIKIISQLCCFVKPCWLLIQGFYQNL